MNKTQDQSQAMPDSAQSTPGNVLPFAESQHRSPAGSHPEATPPRTCPFVRMLYRTAADMRRSSPCCSSGQENRKFPSAHKPQSSVHIVFALLTTTWSSTQPTYHADIGSVDHSSSRSRRSACSSWHPGTSRSPAALPHAHVFVC